jgi:hypothetical protein
MATNALGFACEPHFFDGTHFALWKTSMSNDFHGINPKMLWIIYADFSHALD